MAVLDLGKVVPEKGVDYFTQSDIDGIIAEAKTDIKVGDLQNDAGYITKDVNDLTYYTLATGTGTTIDLSINSSTYVMTLDLKNSAGTTISTDSIDLPLETMVIGATYDSQNKKIVLTLKNGETIDVPVGDLVSGLQTEITSQNKLSSDLVDDTDKTNKFVTASEKTTWSGKQDALVSGTNIKTINGSSVLGSGDIVTETIQYSTMPTASASNLGNIVQYIGTSTNDYINGYFYQVVSDGATTPTYSWQNINVQAGSQANVHYIAENDSTHPFVFAEHELGAYIFPNANDSIYVKGTNENTNNVNLVYSKGVILDYFKLYSEASSQEVVARTNYTRLYKNETGRYTELLHNLKKNESAPTGLNDDTSGTEFHFVEPDTTQSITALKTFTTLPQSSVVPTNDNDLTNKKYVDDQIVQYSTLPVASLGYVGKIAQYTGATDSTYTNGYFYQCISDGQETPTYSWVNINVQPSSGGGQVKVHYIDTNDSTHPFVFEDNEPGIYFFKATEDQLYFKPVSSTSYSLVTGFRGVYLNYFTKFSEASNATIFAQTSYTRPFGSPNKDMHQIYFKKSSASSMTYSSVNSATLNYVDLANNQTIYGTKTFSALPESSGTPTTSNQLVNKTYVDSKSIKIVNIDDNDVDMPDATSDTKWDSIFASASVNSGSVIVIKNDYEQSCRIEAAENSGTKTINLYFVKGLGTKWMITNTSDWVNGYDIQNITMEYTTGESEHWHKTSFDGYGVSNIKVLVNGMDVYGQAPDPASIRFVFSLLGISEYEYSGNYSIGDYVYYENKIYKCNTATTEEDFDIAKWDASTYLDYLNDNLAL